MQHMGKDTQPDKQGPFERRLIRQRKARGQRQAGHAFLYERCAQDAAERVASVNRQFDNVLVFADPVFGEILQAEAGDKIGHMVCAHYSDAGDSCDLICSQTALAFADQSFDLVINGLSLHGVNDVPKACVEINRVLRADGLFIGCLFGGASLGELRLAMYEVEERLLGRVSPRISPMISMDQAAQLLQHCGFAMPVIDRDMVTARYGELKTLLRDLRRMGESNALAGRDKRALSRTFFLALEDNLKNGCSENDGKFQISYDILWLSGWRPCPTQAQPLKPGSAKTKLSDALGVKEHKL